MIKYVIGMDYALRHPQDKKKSDLQKQIHFNSP